MKKIIIVLISILLLSTAWADRELSGTIICNTLYIPGTTMDLEFELDFSSNDWEWIAYCELTFPTGMTPTGTPPPIAGDWYTLEFNFITGQVCAWGAGLGDTSLGFLDVIGEPYVFTCTVDIDAGLSGSQDVEYYCGGDEYGSPPHEFSGTCVVDPALDHDLTGLSVTGNAIPTEGIESIYTITVFNQGNNPADTYTVELYLEGDIFIGSVAGTTIDPGETLVYDIPWTPSSPGVTYLYGYVDYAEDENINNNTTPNFDVNIQSAGTIVVTVGDGTSTSNLIPANFYYMSSLSECWYYPDEINFGGLITQIGYHTNWVTDLNDMPMRIWMGETTQPQALVGWITAGDLTLVFDGTIDLPSGDNDILFPLDTFFGYSGANNLVVMVQRPMDTTYYNFMDTWYITNDVFHPARTVHYYSDWDEMDPYNPSEGYVINDFPNIGFYFDSTPTGSLEGFVYENTAAGRDIIEGALVVIGGTTFSTYTDETGYYNFPYIFTGDYDITVSAFGYYDSMNNVTIIEDETTYMDCYLWQLPNVEVSGHVITSDTGADVEGAIVTLEGYDNYETVTLADGTFLLEGVYCDHIYTLTISNYEGYDPYIDENVDVEDVNLDLGDIIITEIANPPSGVYVEENHEGNAQMLWCAPGSAPAGMENFEDGEANDYIFSDDRWTVEDGYLKFTGQSLNLNGSAYWDNEVEDFTMEFEVQKNSGNGDYAHGAFIRSDGFLTDASCNGYRFNVTQNGSYCVIRYDSGGYTFIQGWTTAANLLTGLGVPNIVLIVANGANFELYFNGALEYSFTDATHPGGFCNVIAYDIQADEVWFDYVNIMQDTRVIADISNFIPVTGNTAIGGDENKAPKKMNKFPSNSVEIRNLKLITESKIPSINSTPGRERLIEGYEVYRLLDGEQEQPENWLEIVTGITDTTYIDESWAFLEIPGVYRYAVIAAYTNDVYSNPAFSNIIEKDMYTEVSVNISTNSGDDPIGANVTLTNQDEDPEHVYTMAAPTGGVCFFQDVYKGVYDLEISLTGFEAYSQENINIFDLITLPIELLELILPPVNLVVEDTPEGVHFSWGEPGTGGWTEDFEDGVIPEGWSQEYVVNTIDWIMAEGGHSGNPPGAHSGSWNVLLYESGSNGSTTKLITPEFNMGAPDTPLTFWHAQVVWAGDQDALYIYYKTTSGGDWTLIASYTGDTPEWTERTVTLPDPSPTYYIAFEGFLDYGYGVCIDDVVVGDGGIERELLYYNVYLDDLINPFDTTTELFYDFEGLGGTHTFGVSAFYSSGNESEIVTIEAFVESEETSIPVITKLSGNYPNPFNPVTNISFSIKEAGQVTIDIYNLRGERVNTLINDYLEPNYYNFEWNGRDENNRSVASGVYFYKMKAGRYTSTKKMILMK